MSIELVYRNDVPSELKIPKKVLPENGIPFSHHFQSTPQDNLIELAGRVCYLSTKQEKTRNSKDYHDNINITNHGSVQTHVYFTLELDSIDDIFSRICLNRPGVFCEPNLDKSKFRITANVRAIKEWNLFNNRFVAWETSKELGVLFQNLIKPMVPFALTHTNEGYFFSGKLVQPIWPEERWYSFYITDVSRRTIYEWNRHSFKTGISQKSTRFCDESENNWSLAPHILETDRSWINEFISSSKQSYDKIVDVLQKRLIDHGIDKFLSRKIARGAGCDLLGHGLSTEMIWSVSLDQAVRIVQQRAHEMADPAIRLLANDLANILENDILEHMQLQLIRKPAKDGIGYRMDFVKV